MYCWWMGFDNIDGKYWSLIYTCIAIFILLGSTGSGKMFWSDEDGTESIIAKAVLPSILSVFFEDGVPDKTGVSAL